MAKIEKSVLQHLFEASASAPEKQALIYESEGVDYGRLKTKVLAAARVLDELGVRRGDRVILPASHRPSFVFGYFAAHYLGAVAVPIDPQINKAHWAYILEQTRPRAAFVTARAAADGSAHPIDLLDGDRPMAADREGPSLDDTADIIFTTGTTGRPKGVVLTHRNIAAAATNINAFIGNGPSDREVIPLPLSHSFGLGRLRCNVLQRATLIVVDGFLSPEAIFRAMDKNGATGFCFVPAGLAILLHLSGNELSRFKGQLKYVEIGSAPMAYEQKRRLMTLLPGTRLCMHYGLTEASRSAFIEFHSSKDKLQSVGQPSPNVEISILDGDGKELPALAAGNIAVRGETVMKEYWNDPQKTSQVLSDGWLLTGDVGHKDAQGYVYLKGRSDEIINVGGLKVSPIEVEDALKTHPAVEDCACVGVPDPKGLSGKVVKVFLVAKAGLAGKPSSEDLTRFLQPLLEAYKIPSVYDWIEAIPKTASGKVQRLQLSNAAVRRSA